MKLTYTLKDKTGATFSSVDSLNIEAKVDDDSVLKPETQYASVPEVEFTKLAKVPGKGNQSRQISHSCIHKRISKLVSHLIIDSLIKLYFFFSYPCFESQRQRRPSGSQSQISWLQPSSFR